MLTAEVKESAGKSTVVFLEEEHRYSWLPGYLVLSKTEMATYNINMLGVILDPGKFIGEHYSTVLFFHSAMDSGADEETGNSETTGYYWKFAITSEEERQQFHVEDDVVGVILAEGSSGFIGMDWYTEQAPFDRTWQEIEAECNEDETCSTCQLHVDDCTCDGEGVQG